MRYPGRPMKTTTTRRALLLALALLPARSGLAYGDDDDNDGDDDKDHGEKAEKREPPFLQKFREVRKKP